MKIDLMEKYGKPVPRYTSYPTAPHFHGGIDGALYRDWLSGLPADEPLSLYLHIPYCDTLCWFCGCHTKITARYEPVARYLQSLYREIDLLADALGDTPRPVAHVHMGGGSPTMLRPDDLKALMARLRSRFDFRPGCEVAIEIDPRDQRPGLYDALAEVGINRISVGVQDANPKVQQAINRIQSIETTRHCIDAMREHGVNSVNIDLIYGLPYQTPAHMEATVRAVLDMAPDRIALFGYAHVPWMKTHQKMIPEDALPGPDDRLESAERAERLLLEAGYVAIGIDHFARPDDPLAVAHASESLNRNFQGYTTDRTSALIGLGASAIGSLPQGYIQNMPSMHDYMRAVDAGDLPVAKGIALSEDDRLRGAVIRELMCYGRVDLVSMGEAHGASGTWFADALPRLDEFVRDGLVRFEDGRRLALTGTGQPFLRTVCAAFDAWLATGKGRHSAAV